MTVGARVSEWRKLPMSLTELCIDTTLRCGQAFRWRKIDDEWHCTLQGRIITLKQDATHLHYRSTYPSSKPPSSAPAPAATLTPPPSTLPSPSPNPLSTSSLEEVDDTLPLLTSYFNLPISLTALYAHWSSVDPVFARRSPPFTGIRILNQPSWEALVAFICSSNNNISRISLMVSRLCQNYGPYLGTVAGEVWHDFPTPKDLSVEGVEGKLRELGFGYRARYIAQTAKLVSERGEGWLDSLRSPCSPALFEVPTTSAVVPTYESAHEALLALPGVGPKVADCVCLMGLGWSEAVPVDTHVWQIATRDYKYDGGGGKGKTFNKAVHDAVGDFFRGVWGEYAGWAQSVMFTSNLKSFKGLKEGVAGEKGEGEEGKVEVGVKEAVVEVGRVVKEEEVQDRVVKIVKTERVTTAQKVDLRSTMRVAKRKAVVKMEVKEEEDGTQVKDLKVVATRTSKRRRVQA